MLKGDLVMFGRIKDFMYGRYGMDHLSIALVVLGSVISSVLSFIRIPFLNLIGLIPLGFAAFRVLSKNIEKRTKENNAFIKFWIPWKNFFTQKMRESQDKEHKYYKCPKCSQKLRVPRNMGKINITCPYCNKEFKKNTGKKPV